MRALTEFLERELRALLSDAPAAATDLDGSEDSESQTQSQSQSQSQAGIGGGGAFALPLAHQLRPRVVVVRATSPSEHMLTLVDRSRMVEAFVPQHVVAVQVLQKHNYASLAALRGSVIRIDKYHFATAQHCELAAANWTPTRRGRTRVCLWVDELSVIDKSDLAVNAAPSVDELADIAQLLQELSDEQLDARITARQGLAPCLPAPASAPAAPTTASVASASDEYMNNDDDEYPLQDDDCIIPEDQEAQLDAQDGWGRPVEAQPSDSQLIAENESQPWGSQTQSQSLNDGDHACSPAFLTQAPDSELMTQEPLLDDDLSSAEQPYEDNSATADAAATDVAATSPAPATDARTDDPAPAATTSTSADAVPESQGFQFQTENIATTFVHCSDTESDSDTGDGINERSSQQSASQGSATKRAAKSVRASQDAAVVPTEVADTFAASLQQAAVTAQDDAETISMHIDQDDTEEQEHGDSAEQQHNGETGVQEQDGDNEDGGFGEVDDPCGDGGFPQTQAPESQEGFPDDADNDADEEPVDAPESETPMVIEDDDTVVEITTAVDSPQQQQQQQEEEAQVDAASTNHEEDHESDDAVVEAQDVAAPAAAEPLTQMPDDSVDESTVERLSASASPERLKRPRDAAAIPSDEHSAQTTPPATQSDNETDTAAVELIETPAAADQLPLAKVPRTEATHTSPRSHSPRASTPAERAIKSYFQTGVPLVITQRDERTQREPVVASARDESRWLRFRSVREPLRRVEPVRHRTSSAR